MERKWDGNKSLDSYFMRKGKATMVILESRVCDVNSEQEKIYIIAVIISNSIC